LRLCLPSMKKREWQFWTHRRNPAKDRF
jgi:hypothetical protein